MHILSCLHLSQERTQSIVTQVGEALISYVYILHTYNFNYMEQEITNAVLEGIFKPLILVVKMYPSSGAAIITGEASQLYLSYLLQSLAVARPTMEMLSDYSRGQRIFSTPRATTQAANLAITALISLAWEVMALTFSKQYAQTPLRFLLIYQMVSM